MATGEEIYNLGEKHVGERYILGAFVPKNNSNWKGPWDCAEFVSWCVFQVSNTLYGCDNDSKNPASADAFTGYWGRDAQRLGKKISISDAAKTKGAAVLRVAGPGVKCGHIVISDGNGGTVEAHSTNRGVIKNTLSGRRWDTGILVPGIDYVMGSVVVSVSEPAGVVYRLKTPMMNDPKIKDIQKALSDKGFDTGGIDGKFGNNTFSAVSNFQSANGLTVDGEVGPDTLKALGIS